MSEPDGLRDRRTVAPFVAMLAAVVVTTVLPFLGSRRFYLSGDAIAEWLPVSRRIGELVRGGDSHLMDPTLWRGGNFVAEARFGLWNPLVVLLDTTVLQLDDLALAALLANLVYLLVLAAGVYLLAREYGAAAPPAALAGVVAATGGWMLWMDAAWWTPHVASLAFVPYVWVAARRVVRGRGGPGWLVLAGAFCVTAGNPYSNIIVVIIMCAVAVEFGDRRRWVPLGALVGALAAIGLIAVFVYLPFRQTSGVGFRESGLSNDESWAPGAGDFLTMSSPTATPFVRNFGRSVLGFPAFYLAWFMLPLAPWLRWRTLARREFAGLGLFAGVLLVLSLGPSSFWLFRWPMRLIPSLYLPVVIAVAVVLGAGLVTDRPRLRAGASAGIVLAGAYLAWADVPDDVGWHLAATAVVLAATATTVFVGTRTPTAMVPVMIVATIVVLAVQLQWRPTNESVRHYGLPTSAATYEDQFAPRYDGTVVPIVDFDAIPPVERNPDGADRDLTIASTSSMAGIEAVGTYSGIGFSTHDAALCVELDGATCADAWNRLWLPAGGSDVPLADLIGADTVVVQRTLVDTTDAAPPPGWSLAEATDHVVVWKRADAREWSDGRLTDVTGPITVDGDVSDGPHREVSRFRRNDDGPAQLTFARLAWPGYEATIDGEPLLVGGGPAGLLTVTIPADASDGEVLLTWRPPYWKLSLLVLALGLLTGLATQIAWMRLGARRHRLPSGEHDNDIGEPGVPPRLAGTE